MNRQIASAGAAIALALSTPALGGFVDLDGGWRASWDDAFDGLVDINSLGYDPTDDALYIQKSAEFRPGFMSIAIIFEAIGVGPASHIVIDDEIIFNNSGGDWSAFEIALGGGQALFDPVRTASSGGSGPIGWTIDPFTDAAFSPDNTRLDISGGTLSNGSFWFPGDGATNGQLWIDIANAQQGSTFTLLETPTPAPGAIALLALAGLAGRRRRR